MMFDREAFNKRMQHQLNILCDEYDLSGGDPEVLRKTTRAYANYLVQQLTDELARGAMLTVIQQMRKDGIL